jgi:hypothetical protein
MDPVSSVVIVFFIIVVGFFSLTSYRHRKVLQERDDQIINLNIELGKYKTSYTAMRALSPNISDTDIIEWVAANPSNVGIL